MMYAVFERCPPVTTYRPSGDIMTMCGFTLLPRKVRPRICFVLMSMNAMSFESRSTIITTEVGSLTMTFAPDAGGGMLAMLCAGGGAGACARAGPARAANEAARETPRSLVTLRMVICERRVKRQLEYARRAGCRPRRSQTLRHIGA